VLLVEETDVHSKISTQTLTSGRQYENYRCLGTPIISDKNTFRFFFFNFAELGRTKAEVTIKTYD
jgi:hypothetical protein